MPDRTTRTRSRDPTGTLDNNCLLSAKYKSGVSCDCGVWCGVVGDSESISILSPGDDILAVIISIFEKGDLCVKIEDRDIAWEVKIPSVVKPSNSAYTTWYHTTLPVNIQSRINEIIQLNATHAMIRTELADNSQMLNVTLVHSTKILIYS